MKFFAQSIWIGCLLTEIAAAHDLGVSNSRLATHPYDFTVRPPTKMVLHFSESRLALASTALAEPAIPAATNGNAGAFVWQGKELAAAFAPFGRKVKTHWDSDFFYVESEGMPAHNMMIGIQNWQQQGPVPQPYSPANAWRLPLKPAISAHPISTRNNLFRGAIAIAVNGVPIFNALNNRGEDSFKIGELDEWGGHCGRADDYHYHVAPFHLQEIAGRDQPIAVALDGFPVYGLTEPDGSVVGALDEFNGHFDRSGRYHYHGPKTYPYINGGIKGVVDVANGQIEPQPRAFPIRPALDPLRGAVITGFESRGTNQFHLVYALSGRTNIIDYLMKDDGTVVFTFSNSGGSSTSEVYRRQSDRFEPRPNGREGRRPPP